MLANRAHFFTLYFPSTATLGYWPSCADAKSENINVVKEKRLEPRRKSSQLNTSLNMEEQVGRQLSTLAAASCNFLQRRQFPLPFQKLTVLS
jgi:hypothetical protein